MSELSFSSKNSNFSSIDLLADFFRVCFFILSHPLYFSYFIFFSPYLLKLLSFLSPLFVTTALLVLAYLTVSPNSTSDLPKIKVGTCCLVTTYQTVVAKLQYPKVDHSNGDDHEEFGSFEELEVYKIVFDTSSLEVRESPVEEMSSEEASDAPIDQSYSLGGNGSIGYFLEAACAILEEIKEISVEEMSSEQAFDAPIDESSSLEGSSTTGHILEGASAIWEEKEENQDEKNSSAQVFDASFDERSSPESSESSGYFSEASSAAVEQNPIEKKCSSQVSDAPIDGKSSPEGNGSTDYFFEASSAVLKETRENLVEKQCSSQVSDAPIDKSSSLEGKGSTGNVLEAASVILIQKAVEEEKEVKPLSAYFDKVEDGEEKRLTRRESKDRDLGANDGGFRSKSMVIKSQFLGSNLGSPGEKAMEDSQIMGPNLGSFGSMRKEKEWRRTLACKLFEERHHNVDGGGEGMDMLWETYDETESGKALQGIKSKSKKQGKKINGNKIDHNEVDGDDGEEEEDEELDNGQLCCLQALKFSAGKMNLGHMGRPNLVKITKALKGFGWLHHVTKHSKKGYH
ncbi:PREDICTED: uncharacterized protein LOC101302725 [Fragaria vesca subsp. vesca]|uniref:uncharacterized protein LOC101302725 n=1 Tax=Fragaria vesca subsp. vesca TaxID=101020 RepID=UPI0002C2F4AB|nr:PREDICTED: uncharacterized protein LOC101302725 [Fragaria vesca subsp. vesca]